jgi:hypothetical protein
MKKSRKLIHKEINGENPIDSQSPTKNISLKFDDFIEIYEDVDLT